MTVRERMQKCTSGMTVRQRMQKCTINYLKARKKEKSSPVLSNEESWFSCEDSFLKVFLKTTNVLT